MWRTSPPLFTNAAPGIRAAALMAAKTSEAEGLLRTRP